MQESAQLKEGTFKVPFNKTIYDQIINPKVAKKFV